MARNAKHTQASLTILYFVAYLLFSSNAFSTPTTSFEESIHEITKNNPDQTGLYLLPNGMDALVTRLVAIEAAEKSIDFQYYIFKDDSVGRLFLGKLLEAADRGVKVRILVDDLAKTWKDRHLAYAASHPNLEISLFNPPVRIGSIAPLKAIARVRRIHRRMHNKELVIDRKLAIIGGRNIANEYFDASDRNVADLDAIVVGDAVPSLSSFFQEYWDYRLSIPIEEVAKRKKVTDEKVKKFRDSVRTSNQSEETKNYESLARKQAILSQITENRLTFHWGKADAIADRPQKLDKSRNNDTEHLMPKMAPYFDNASADLLLISPYFIPERSGSRWLSETAERGVNITVATNSFESNNHMLVHSAYMKYRKRLLKSGVNLYETQSAERQAAKVVEGDELSQNPQALLHTKLFLIDHRYVVVGSFNLDPRSRILNTELVLVFESTELASNIDGQLKKSAPGKFWKLLLDDKNKIKWQDTASAEIPALTKEPGMNWSKALRLRLLRLIPIEQQL